MQNNEEIIKLINQALPQPSIDTFTYISTKTNELEQWVDNVGVLDLAEASKQIKTSLVEIAHFRTDPATKLDMMEALRTPMLHLINKLSNHYLNQSLVLDQKSISIAKLVQFLYAYSFAIYRQLAYTFVKKNPEKKISIGKIFGTTNTKPALCLHRAITTLAKIIQESDLLYVPSLTGNWKQINVLYSFAEESKLLDIKVADVFLSHIEEKTSIKDAFMRSVLMSIFRTNSLRQHEIQKLFNYTEIWSPLITVNKNPSAQDFFLVDLHSDFEPQYINTDKQLSDALRYIDINGLLTHLKNIKASSGEDFHKAESQLFKSSLIDYIIKSIEEPAERTSNRHPFDGKLQATIGMLSCHYHISDKKEFKDVIQKQRYVKEQSSSKSFADIEDFSSSLKLDGEDEETEDLSDEFAKLKKLTPIGLVSILDISPGGYKVTWQGKSPKALKTGEIICIREAEDKPWQVGVIRWVQQSSDQSANIGIEVIAAKSSSCGVMPSQSKEEAGEFMRAIILPEIKSLNRPATIITPNYHFQNGHRIKIRRGNADVTAKLGKQYLKTQSFNQYDFTVIPTKKVD